MWTSIFHAPVIVNYNQESNLSNLKIMIIHAAQSMCHFIRGAGLLLFILRVFLFLSLAGLNKTVKKNNLKNRTWTLNFNRHKSLSKFYPPL